MIKSMLTNKLRGPPRVPGLAKDVLRGKTNKYINISNMLNIINII